MIMQVTEDEEATTLPFLARLDKVQEKLLSAAASVFAKVLHKVFYVMGKALSGEHSCSYDRSCYFILLSWGL